MAIKYHNVIITDIQLHTQAVRKPKSFARQLAQSLRNKLPGRVFGHLLKPDKQSLEKREIKIPIALPTAEELYKIPKLRGKTVRFLMPKAGIPIYAGPDTVGFLKAREKRKWKVAGL